MYFLNQIVFSIRNGFNPTCNIMQLFQHHILARRNTMHPPEADNPARQPEPGKRDNNHF
jgi:hypothetical protein